MTPAVARAFVAAIFAFGWTAESRSAIETIVFAGSGGCDNQDKQCKDPPVGTGTPEKTVWQYGFDQGNLTLMSKRDVGGIPAWFVGKEQDVGPDCLFVMLADTNALLSFQIHEGGALVHQGSVSSHGATPVHGSISSAGNTLLVANYHGPDDICNSTGAGAASFSIDSECGLKFADWKPAHGSSVMKSRQCSSHVHSFTADANRAFACDLGADVISIYKVSPDSKLILEGDMPTPPGSGPRHIAIHPTMGWVYLVTEMTSEVIVYKPSANKLSKLPLVFAMSTTTLPMEQYNKSLEGEYGSKAAEIIVSHNGEFVYVSNRAFKRGWYSSIAVFQAFVKHATVVLKQHIESPDMSRGMALSPCGKFIIVEGQRHGTVQTFAIGTDGLLTKSGFAAVEGPPAAAGVIAVRKPMKLVTV